MPDCQYLFVYGTLRQIFGHPMHDWLARHARWMGEATLQGTLFSLGDYPGAVVSSRSEDQVKGDVYEVLAAGPLFVRLDDYEDYFPENPAVSLYLRRVHEVELAGGQRIKSWVYVYNRPVIGLPWVASGDWRTWREKRSEGEEGET